MAIFQRLQTIGYESESTAGVSVWCKPGERETRSVSEAAELSRVWNVAVTITVNHGPLTLPAGTEFHEAARLHLELIQNHAICRDVHEL